VFTIYQVINKLNGESYIGFTTKNPPILRWMNHQWDAKNGSQVHFHRAVRKYGEKEFEFSILEEGWDTKIGLNIREPYWISVLKPEYNSTSGGEGGKTVGNTGKRASQKTRALIGAKSKGRHLSPECRAKMSADRKGIKFTPERCARISAGQKERHRRNKEIK
jgi:group I intron endonuclease